MEISMAMTLESAFDRLCGPSTLAPGVRNAILSLPGQISTLARGERFEGGTGATSAGVVAQGYLARFVGGRKDGQLTGIYPP